MSDVDTPATGVAAVRVFAVGRQMARLRLLSYITSCGLQHACLAM